MTACFGEHRIRHASTRAATNASSAGPDSAEDFVVEQERILIDQLRRGDPQGWTALVDRYGALIRRRVGDVAQMQYGRMDWSLVDDATAEVFASLLANDQAAIRAFAGRSRLSTYLAVIATRVARREFSSLAKRHMLTNQQTDLNIETGADSASLRLENQEQRERLMKLLERLPPMQRKLIQLHYHQGLTYREINERHGIPLGTIGPTLRRAEQQLRTWLENDQDQ